MLRGNFSLVLAIKVNTVNLNVVNVVSTPYNIYWFDFTAVLFHGLQEPLRCWYSLVVGKNRTIGEANRTWHMVSETKSELS